MRVVDSPQAQPHEFRSLALSDREFSELAQIVQTHIGIKMPFSKKPMVASRLLRRLHSLRLGGYDEYCRYIQSPAGWQSEEPHFADLVTTHKTQFFREPDHFDYLVQTAIQQLETRGKNQTIKVWSAACSTGEEAYTLAMVLQDSRQRATRPSFDFDIVGTDISEFVLQTAKNAIYPVTQVNEIPEHYRSQFLMRGIEGHSKFVRIVPELRSRTTFQILNFVDSDWALGVPFDVIFCRNVLIYFDAQAQRRIIAGLCERLRTGGFLFLGHAEYADVSLMPLESRGRTIYRKCGIVRKGAQ